MTTVFGRMTVKDFQSYSEAANTIVKGTVVNNEEIKWYTEEDYLQEIASKGGSESVLPPNTKPDFIVTPEGTVMDTSKNYNLVGSGKQGDWFQIHNYGKPEDGFGFPHTHKSQLNTNGTIKL